MATPNKPPPGTLTAFTLFSSLPTELQLKIWRTVANSAPRTITVWNEWQKCKQENTMFYIQSYTTELSCRSPCIRTVLSSACHSSRSVIQHAYALEFLSTMTVSNTIYAERPATMYINFAIDTIAPRGYYNIVAFADLVSRVKGRLRSVALDVNGSFWKENLVHYLRSKNWVLNGVREIFLYVSSGELAFKGSEYLEKFRKREIGRRDLSFVEIVENMDVLDVVASDREGEALSEDEAVAEREVQRASLKALKEGQGILNRWFDIISGASTATEEEQLLAKNYYKDPVTTPGEVFLRPEVKLMKMVVTKPPTSFAV